MTTPGNRLKKVQIADLKENKKLQLFIAFSLPVILMLITY